MKDDDAFKTWLSGEHPETPVPSAKVRRPSTRESAHALPGLSTEL